MIEFEIKPMEQSSLEMIYKNELLTLNSAMWSQKTGLNGISAANALGG